MNIKKCNPKLSNKYSVNFHRWLTKNEKEKSIFSLGSPLAYRPFRDEHDEIWMGFIDDNNSFVGVKVRNIMLFGAKRQCGSFLGLGSKMKPYPDFFSEYEKIGRCLFDKDHRDFMENNEGRFDEKDGFKKCGWCGWER